MRPDKAYVIQYVDLQHHDKVLGLVHSVQTARKVLQLAADVEDEQTEEIVGARVRKDDHQQADALHEERQLELRARGCVVYVIPL